MRVAMNLMLPSSHRDVININNTSSGCIPPLRRIQMSRYANSIASGIPFYRSLSERIIFSFLNELGGWIIRNHPLPPLRGNRLGNPLLSFSAPLLTTRNAAISDNSDQSIARSQGQDCSLNLYSDSRFGCDDSAIPLLDRSGVLSSTTLTNDGTYITLMGRHSVACSFKNTFLPGLIIPLQVLAAVTSPMNR